MSGDGEILYIQSGGEGAPVLLLLHGLGVNGDAFGLMLGLVEKNWPGRFIVPDFAGHGRSPHRSPYSYGRHAADVATLFAQGEEIAVIGHSMGGVIAMMLASGCFGVKVTAALAFGVKIAWTGEEVEKLHELARKPARSFATQAEAVERYLRVSGMQGLVAPGDAAALSGVCNHEGAFLLASDPRITAVADPDVEAIAKTVRSPLKLVAGVNDPMVTLADMQRIDAAAISVPDAGHNLHLERPDLLWEVFAAIATQG